MNAINEAELTDFMKNKAIKRLTIVQSEEGKYRIVINLTWKEGDWNLVTTRGGPREWASLDRLIRHLSDKYESLPPITLVLCK
jgi:hypothetical protein